MGQLSGDEAVVLLELGRRVKATAIDIWESDPERFFMSDVARILSGLIEQGIVEQTGEYYAVPENPYYRLTPRGESVVELARKNLRLVPDEPIHV